MTLQKKAATLFAATITLTCSISLPGCAGTDASPFPVTVNKKVTDTYTGLLLAKPRSETPHESTTAIAYYLRLGMGDFIVDVRGSDIEIKCLASYVGNVVEIKGYISHRPSRDASVVGHASHTAPFDYIVIDQIVRIVGKGLE